MKLLIFINDLKFFITHRLPIAEEALSKGFEVVILYGDLGGAKTKKLIQKGIKLKHISIKRKSINPFNDLISLLYIWKFFKDEKPDIVHLITIKPYLYGGIISYLTNVPALVSAVSGLGTIFINENFKYKFLRLLLYPFYKLAFKHINQKVIFQNEDDLKVLVKWGILNPSKTKLIKGSGVQIDHFTELEEPEGIPTICFASRLIKEKGIYEFIDAARLLIARGIKVKFYIAGNLDKYNPSKLSDNYINNLKQESYLHLLGYHDDIPSLYSKSNIICLPSYREGLPKSLMEAAAASRAVVTTDTPGCRDAIIPNKTGILVPVKDSKKLADALQWLIENPQRRIRMGKAGRKLAEKEFTIEKIVEKHINIYKSLLKSKL